MLKVKLLNANGYFGLEGYPFPRLIPIRKCREAEALRSSRAGSGLVKVTLRDIINAAPGWSIPSWWVGHMNDELSISRGDYFADEGDHDGKNHERIMGWGEVIEVPDNPFHHWNTIKASRPVGAAW